MIVTFHITPHWAYQGTVAEMPDHIWRAYMNKTLSDAVNRRLT